MKKRNRILFHLGLPKAASTTISQNIFLNNSEINFLSKHSVDKHLINFIKHAITTLNDVYFYKNLAKVKAKFNQLSLDDEAINILSESAMMNEDFCENIKRFSLVVEDRRDDIEFLIIIRNQSDTILSSINHNDMILMSEIDNFINLLFENGLDSPSTPNFFKTLDYKFCYEFIKELFPNSRIHILQFELLKNNKALFQRKLSEILDIKNIEIGSALNVSKKSSEEDVYYPRAPVFPAFLKLASNPFLYSFVISGSRRRSFKTLSIRLKNYIKKSVQKEKHFVSLDEAQKKKITEIYSRSNAYVSDKAGLDLEKYNYF